MPKYLFIITELPFTNVNCEEHLELALGFAAIGATISVLFMGEGCLQLISSLNTKDTGFSKKSLGIIPSLSTYDINDIYILQEDLAKFKLNITQLSIQPAIITKPYLSTLYKEHDFIINNGR